MEIAWLGHSCVRLRSRGVTLIADPYGDSLGIELISQDADIVTVSCPDPHHAAVDAIGGDPKVLKGPGEYEVSGFSIKGMGTDRNSDTDERIVNTVYRIRTEGLTLCHLGDLNTPLTARQVEYLDGIDVLFAPAGGGCTLSPTAIAQLVGRIAPRIVVPLHYSHGGLPADLEPIDDFLAAMGGAPATPGAKLGVTATSLPGDTQVSVLERAR